MATSAPTCSKGGGKLIPPSSSGAPKNEAKHWVFRWSNYAKHCPEWAAALDALIPQCKILVAQEEICPTTGTPHIQGELEFHKKHRPIGMLPKSVKWILKIDKKNWNYCQKTESSVPGGRVWRHGIKRPFRPLDKTLETELYGWQLEYAHKFDEPAPKVNRKIHWVWSEAGARGKSTMCRYFVDLDNINTLCVGGEVKDIFSGIADWVAPEDPGDAQNLDLIVINIPRAQMNRVSFTAIECILDGLFYNGKYKSRMVRFNPPHVIVFANAPPVLQGTASPDRWVIKNIDEVVESTLEM